MSAGEIRASVALASIFALRMLGLFLILPVFAVHARRMPGGDNTALVGIALGIYGLTQGVLQIPMGAASDRFGRKQVIVAGLAIFALGSFLAAVAGDIFWVIVGRALQGAGAISAAVTAFIADSTREQHRTKATALVGASIGLTFAVSLVAAPVLYAAIGMGGLFALEFIGPAMDSLSMPGRLCMSNMAHECGAKVGLFNSDEVTRKFLESRGRADGYTPLSADPDATYEWTLDFDVSTLEPMLACPHFVDNVQPVRAVEPVAVNQVFIGTSTNGRLEDSKQAASILKGRKVAGGTRLLITPGSRTVLLDGLADGTFQALAEAGGVITGPGCGACVGVHEGVLADGEVCLSAQNRNFKGRMGNHNAFIYLACPATAAATAVTGKITDPRHFLS